MIEVRFLVGAPRFVGDFLLFLEPGSEIGLLAGSGVFLDDAAFGRLVDGLKRRREDRQSSAGVSRLFDSRNRPLESKLPGIIEHALAL